MTRSQSRFWSFGSWGRSVLSFRPARFDHLNFWYDHRVQMRGRFIPMQNDLEHVFFTECLSEPLGIPFHPLVELVRGGLFKPVR